LFVCGVDRELRSQSLCDVTSGCDILRTTRWGGEVRVMNSMAEQNSLTIADEVRDRSPDSRIRRDCQVKQTPEEAAHDAPKKVRLLCTLRSRSCSRVSCAEAMVAPNHRHNLVRCVYTESPLIIVRTALAFLFSAVPSDQVFFFESN
jgi:hypothetical protein